MITIKSAVPATLRIYLDDELFIDQQLPWSTTKLTTDTEEKPRKMRIQNMGDHVLNAMVGDKNHYFKFGDYSIEPGQSVNIT
jgi:hypothetical protein